MCMFLVGCIDQQTYNSQTYNWGGKGAFDTLWQRGTHIERNLAVTDSFVLTDTKQDLT